MQGALNVPWIFDIDTTIKPLCGKQEGAEIGYNPHKPGRPSHALHTYLVGNLRLVLDAVVVPGNESSSASSRPGLIELCFVNRFRELPTPSDDDGGEIYVAPNVLFSEEFPRFLGVVLVWVNARFFVNVCIC